MSTLLLRQSVGYGLVGAAQLLVDWGMFVGISALGVPAVPANIAGRLFGACLGFYLNGVFTFRTETGGRLGWPRFRRYAATWGLLTLVSSAAMYAIDRLVGLGWAWAAKPVVDVGLAAVAFLLSRVWIYR
ncbi:GtrA family protein [Aerolutibacter ruishenii]|uniref:Putative flippase GtrA n=1 Tax=Aerolutibacter ruishenii TaxID=686800 RepID=A0A562M320_9GAMM|nr:GtrA family protein [Lysobacter ruishenii]TWI14253.1 putative flippase GtrA [Lysobacter ruishenii]